MVKGYQRSRTLRRIYRKLPGGSTQLRYEKRKPGYSSCAECGIILKGTKRMRTTKLQNTAKSCKRPSRPYGGYLCSKCSRNKIKEMTRGAKL